MVSVKQLKIEAKEQKGGYLGMLLGSLTARAIRNMLAGKVVIRASEGTIRAGRGTIRAGQNF